MKVRFFIYFLCLFTLSLVSADSTVKSSGSTQEKVFLKPDEAFIMSARVVAPDKINVYWQITDGHYLYYDKFAFNIIGDVASIDQAAVAIPRGKVKKASSFGNEEINFHEVNVDLTVIRSATTKTPVTLQIKYQGCKENSICYPPITKQVALTLGSFTSSPTATTQNQGLVAINTKQKLSEQDQIIERLKSASLRLNIAAFFGFGLLLSFTPCIFPMIPILSGIIIGQGEKITPARGFTLSAAYVIAMALTYALVGIIAAMLHFNLQAASQNAWVISIFSLVFVALALSMLGFYEIQLPASIQSKLTNISGNQQGGSHAGVFVMGALSAIIVGPCVTPPLAGALLYVSQTGEQLLGVVALFALGIGMGTPLLILGWSAGSLLPKAGAWMEAIKQVFGVLLIAIAVWLMSRIVPSAVELFLWATLLIVTAIYMGALDQLKEDTASWRWLWKGIGMIVLVYGIVLVIGAFGGSKNALKPLDRFVQSSGNAGAGIERELAFKEIKSLEDLQAKITLANSLGKTVMLDFYADWCAICIEMKTYTFSEPEVQMALKDVVLLQADVTKNDEVDQVLMKNFDIFGPPVIIFFGKDSKERRSYRLVGFVKAKDFTAHIRETLRS